MKIIAVDYGKKRTGIAETDDLQIIASPLTTVPTEQLMDFLEKYLSENAVETVVVGEPLRDDGTYNEIEKDIRNFIKRLQKKYPALHIEREDERFTSKQAVRAMVEGGLPKMKRRDKAMTDKISAAIILQDYLNRIK